MKPEENGILTSVRQMLEKAQFNFEPAYQLPALLTNPFYLIRVHLYQLIKQDAPKLKGTVLDFGCGSKPYRHLFTNCTRYIGVDIENDAHSHENEQIDVYYDGKRLPFRNASFDNVFTSEVLEYVDQMDDILDEINRVLKPGGLFLLTTPFVWNENEMPHDFARYPSSGMIKLLHRHGFQILRFSKSCNYIETLYQMKAEYYRYEAAKRNNIWLDRAVQLGVIAPLTLRGLLAGSILPDNDSFYGTNVVLCRKIR